jgi:hypothetical protein
MSSIFYDGFLPGAERFYSGSQWLQIPVEFLRGWSWQCFFITFPGDPIAGLVLQFDWDRRPLKGAPLRTDAEKLTITVSRPQSLRIRSPLLRFVKLRTKFKTENSFRAWIADHDISSQVQQINAFFEAQGASRSFLASPSTLLSDFVIECTRSESARDFCALWHLFLKRVRSTSERGILLPNVRFERIDFSACLIYQKLQLINFCTNLITSKTHGFAQTKDLYDQSKRWFKNTNSDEFLLEVFRTYMISEPNASIEAFQVEYGRLPPVQDALPAHFDATTQRELAIEFLNELLPTQVMSELIPILIDCFIFSLTVPPNLQTAEDARAKAISLAQNAADGTAFLEVWKECQACLLRIAEAGSLAVKVKDNRIADELIENGSSVLEAPLINGFLQDIGIPQLSDRFIFAEQYRFEGVLPGITGRCFACRELHGGHPRRVLATSIGEAH